MPSVVSVLSEGSVRKKWDLLEALYRKLGKERIFSNKKLEMSFASDISNAGRVQFPPPIP